MLLTIEVITWVMKYCALKLWKHGYLMKALQLNKLISHSNAFKGSIA